jgi:hypothetical protein
MRDILVGVVMALLLLAALLIIYLAVVFFLSGANLEAFLRILESLWRSGVFGSPPPRFP